VPTGGLSSAEPQAKRGVPLVGLATIILAVSTAHGANYAHDSAADPAYNAGWVSGSNGGSGWGTPWNMGGVGGSEFIGSSARNGASIDAQGRAFGMKLNGGGNGNAPVIGASRLFSNYLKTILLI